MLFESPRQAGKGFEFAILFDRFVFLERGEVRLLALLARVLDEFRGDGQGQPARVHQFGFQDRVQINGIAFMLVHQAVWTGPLGEAEKASAIDRNRKTALEPGGVEHLITDEPAHTIGAQLGKGSRTDMAQKMAQGLVHRQGVLLGLSQAVGIFQDVRFEIAQLKVQLAAAAQLQAKKEQSPPAKEADVIGDHRLKARIGQSLESRVESRPEVADGFDEGAAQS